MPDLFHIISLIIIYDQRRLYRQLGITSPHSFDQYHVWFFVFLWIDKLHPLRLQFRFHHIMKYLRQPERTMYHVKMSSRFQ